MLAITRFRPQDANELIQQAAHLLPLLRQCEGALEASLLQAVDEPDIFALVTRWEAAGHYRHALGRVDVRMLLLPMSLTAIDEPGAFEAVLESDDGGVVTQAPRAVVDGPWVSAREATEGDWVG